MTIPFTSALLGYFFVTRVLGRSVTAALAAAGLVSFATLVLEVVLFMLRETRAPAAKAAKKLN